MATYYPTSDDEYKSELDQLRKRNEELVADNMHKSAEISRLREELKRIKTELEIFAGQKGHNLCWADAPRMLKATIGHTGKYPDSDNVTRE